jgi:DNA-directed RNA polymerase subunit M/transcription elongation factor TFIIS
MIPQHTCEKCLSFMKVEKEDEEYILICKTCEVKEDE